MTPDDVIAAILRDESLPKPARHSDEDCIVISVRVGSRELVAIWFHEAPSCSAIRVSDSIRARLHDYDPNGLHAAIAELRGRADRTGA